MIYIVSEYASQGEIFGGFPFCQKQRKSGNQTTKLHPI